MKEKYIALGSSYFKQHLFPFNKARVWRSSFVTRAHYGTFMPATMAAGRMPKFLWFFVKTAHHARLHKTF